MVKPGDRVILSFVPNCGHCHSCESGQPHLCDEHARTSGKLYDSTSRLHTLAGQDLTHMGKVACFAEYAVVPEAGCIPAPACARLRRRWRSSAAASPPASAPPSSTRGSQPGDSVAVIGCGGVGLNVLQGARLAGATTIVAVDVKDAALDLRPEVRGHPHRQRARPRTRWRGCRRSPAAAPTSPSRPTAAAPRADGRGHAAQARHRGHRGHRARGRRRAHRAGGHHAHGEDDPRLLLRLGPPAPGHAAHRRLGRPAACST